MHLLVIHSNYYSGILYCIWVKGCVLRHWNNEMVALYSFDILLLARLLGRDNCREQMIGIVIRCLCGPLKLSYSECWSSIVILVNSVFFLFLSHLTDYFTHSCIGLCAKQRWQNMDASPCCSSSVSWHCVSLKKCFCINCCLTPKVQVLCEICRLQFFCILQKCCIKVVNKHDQKLHLWASYEHISISDIMIG